MVECVLQDSLRIIVATLDNDLYSNGGGQVQ